MMNLAKNASKISQSIAEGSSQLIPCREKIKITCLICGRLVFQRIQPNFEEEQMKMKRNLVFKNLCDELHLSKDEIPNQCHMEMFPTCRRCCEKVERLWEYNEEIKTIQEKKEATLQEIRRTVTDSEGFQQKIRNSNPLQVETETKKFKRLREVILKANRDAWRNPSEHNDGLVDEPLERSEDIGIVTQNRDQIMETTANGVALLDGFNPIAAPRIRCPSASRASNSKGQKVLENNCCVFCAKSFPHKGALMQHLLTHVREKPFTCNVCGKECGRIGNLTTHITIHTGEKPFKCNLCFKTFNHKSNLGTHIKTHTGERPFKCNLCFTTFIQKSNLVSHLKTHIRK